MGHLAKLWTEVSFFFLPELSQKAKKIVRDGKRERGGGRGRWKEGRGEGSEWPSVRTSVCSDDEKSRLSSRWGHHTPVPVLDSRKPDVR